METQNTGNKNWYKALLSEVNSLSEELGLDDFSTNRLRDFVVTNAKEQYKVGNKSGIHWAFKKQRGEDGQGPPVQAMA